MIERLLRGRLRFLARDGDDQAGAGAAVGASLGGRRPYSLARQFSTLGERLVFSNGILVLAALAALLLILFRGETHALIPLYAVGVFISFTLSQCGMVVHHFRERDPGWRRALAVNALGMVTTFVVLVVISVTKFAHGAWMVIVTIPALFSVRPSSLPPRRLMPPLASSEPLPDSTPFDQVNWLATVT